MGRRQDASRRAPGSAVAMRREGDGPGANGGVIPWARAWDAFAPGLAILDTQGQVLACNRSWVETLSRKADEYAGRHVDVLREITNGQDRPRSRALLSARRNPVSWQRADRSYRVTAGPIRES